MLEDLPVGTHYQVELWQIAGPRKLIINQQQTKI